MRACRDEFGAPIGHLVDVGPGEYHKRGHDGNRSKDEQAEVISVEDLSPVSHLDAGRMIMSRKHWDEYRKRVDNA